MCVRTIELTELNRLGEVVHGATVSACWVASALDSGDHTIFNGSVPAIGATDGHPPVSFDGGYRTLVRDD